MRRIIVFCFAVILFAAPICTLAQQDGKPTEIATHYYRLSYSIQEVGETGKVTNSRAYATSIATGPGQTAQIRTGDKVPMVTDNKGEVQYVDVGVSIDCTRAQEVDGKLSVQMTADISNTTKGNWSARSTAHSSEQMVSQCSGSHSETHDHLFFG